MRNAFSEEIYKHIKKNKNIYIVAADISPSGKMAEISEKNDKQIINVGVAEQVMVGVAAGLSMEKNKVFCYTIAPFSLYRPFEFVRDDLCLQKLPVTIVGMGAGTIYSELGPTHTAIEDISIARSLPNLNIIAPCDKLEVKEAVRYCLKNKKNPIYLRIGKSGETDFTKNAKDKWRFGKIRNIISGKKVCILTYGPIIKLAFKLREICKEKISIYSCHTLEPFDKKNLKNIQKKYKKIICIEDHVENGGLKSIVSEILLGEKFSNKFHFFHLKKKFLNSYDSQESLQEKHGLSIKNIIKKTKLTLK